MLIRRTFVALILLVLCFVPIRAVDGFLDPNFNSMNTFPEEPGKEQISFSGVFLPAIAGNDFAANYAIAVDEDGNYVSVGFTTSETAILNLGLSSFAAVKVDPDGEPITNFGESGFAAYNFGSFFVFDSVDQAFDVVVDQDNCYVLAGRTTSNGDEALAIGGPFNFGVVKTSSTGLPDSAFDAPGSYPDGFGGYNFVNAITLDVEGVVDISIENSNDEAFGVAVDEVGDYVFVGRTTAQSGSLVEDFLGVVYLAVAAPVGLHNFAVIKTSSTGFPDQSFGGNFVETLAFSLFGPPAIPRNPGFGVYSFVDIVGTVDLGVLSVSAVISASNDQAFDVAIDPTDNSYILAGLTTASSTGGLLPVLIPELSNFGVVKISSGGIPDPSFNSPGFTTKPGFGSYSFTDDDIIDTLISIDAGFSVAVDKDGNYVIAGVTNVSQTGIILTDGTNIAVLKISPTGLPVASFGNSIKPGYGIYDLGGSILLGTSFDAGFSVRVDNDNKYVIVGTSNADNGGLLGDTGSIAVLRLTTDGDLDPTFNPQGFPESLPFGPGAALVGYDGSLDVLFIDNVLALSTPGAGGAIDPSDGAILAAGGVFDIDVLSPLFPLLSQGILSYDFSIAKFLDDGPPPAPPINPLLRNLIPMAAA